MVLRFHHVKAVHTQDININIYRQLSNREKLIKQIGKIVLFI